MPRRRTARVPLVLVAFASVVAIVAESTGSLEGDALAQGEAPALAPAEKPAADEPLLSTFAPKVSVTPPAGSGAGCGEGQVEVEGDYCPFVEQSCLRWLDPETKLRCAEFAPSVCHGKLVHKHFCIDRFEYPNKPGVKPNVMVTWYQARDACAAQGKRLCGDSEWTLACEGQERLPYPYGYSRNAEACNIDKPYIVPDEKALGNPATRDAEAARLDQREPSGARESCVSPYGVHDMSGNVDEWVVNESGKPFKSGLKGGYWGPVRTRCRPMTTAHDENFAFYQIGFRCCSDLSGAAAPGTGKADGRPVARAMPSSIAGS